MRLALQYIIAKWTLYISMYKTKVDKPCINFCNLRLTATLRDSGNLTYSRMRKLLKAKLEELGFPNLASIALEQGEQQQQLWQGSLTETSSNMVWLLEVAECKKWLHRRPIGEEVKGTYLRPWAYRLYISYKNSECIVIVTIIGNS